MDTKAVGRRIKNIRLKLGMTTEKFAQIFNDQPPSKGTISKWENGHYLPNNERLKRIAEIGETTVDYLLYGSLDEYARNLLNGLKEELYKDNSISKGTIPLIISEVENRLFPKYLHHIFKDRESLEEAFTEYKKDAIELWTNRDKLDVELVKMIGNQLSYTITDNLKYFYSDFYKNEDNSINSGKKISDRSNEFIKRLVKLDNYNRAYIEKLRFLENEKIATELDRIEKYTDDLDN